MDKEEIMAEARALGSYAISIVPDQDCCTLFTPRNPLTRGRLPDVEAAERALPIDEIVDTAAANAVVEDCQYPVVGSAVGGARWPQ
jgi:tRNA uracil 4-sulfurtransferase